MKKLNILCIILLIIYNYTLYTKSHAGWHATCKQRFTWHFIYDDFHQLPIRSHSSGSCLWRNVICVVNYLVLEQYEINKMRYYCNTYVPSSSSPTIAVTIKCPKYISVTKIKHMNRKYSLSKKFIAYLAHWELNLWTYKKS